MTPQSVLLLGNSHTAAPRVALRDHPDRWRDFAPRIFAMPGDFMVSLVLENGNLLPSDDSARHHMLHYNGVPELPLAGHDAFVVIGCLNFLNFTGLQETRHSLDFPSAMRGEECQPALVPVSASISTGLMDAMMRHMIENSPALRLIRLLASLDQGPILFMDTVLPSAECWQQEEIFSTYLAMAERGDAAAWHARYIRILHEVLGQDATYLPQPPQTITEEVFTAPEWMRGSLRMQPRRDIPHEKTDFGHANPAYGALQLDLIAEALARL